MVGGQALIPVSETRFLVGESGVVIEFDGDARGGRPSGSVLLLNGDTFRIEPVPEFAPSSEELAEYAGEYHSDEAEVTYRMEMKDSALVRVDRYGESGPLRAAYPDAFFGPQGFYIFHRDGGRVTSFSWISGRVWDLRFQRVDESSRR
jgi:hypothetical protein